MVTNMSRFIKPESHSVKQISGISMEADSNVPFKQSLSTGYSSQSALAMRELYNGLSLRQSEVTRNKYGGGSVEY